jgi:hypothetical protein
VEAQHAVIDAVLSRMGADNVVQKIGASGPASSRP